MTVVFVSTAMVGTDDGDGDAYINARVVLKSAILGAATGTQARVTLRWGSAAGSGSLNDCWIGQCSTATVAYGFTGTQVPILFSGSTNTTFAVGTAVVSDWSTLGEAYDNTKSYVTSFHMSSIGAPSVAYVGVTNSDLYYDGTGLSNSSQNSPSLGTADPNKSWFISQLEVQTPGGVTVTIYSESMNLMGVG